MSSTAWSSTALIGATVLGLLIGSFLNVVIWRVPRGESVVRPASHCPSCGAGILPRDNIPIISWLLLRRRCRTCANPISARYPAVELATGLVFLALAVRIGLSSALPAFLYLGAAGVALALIDIDVHRLPNAIVLPSYAVGALLLGAAAVADSNGHGALRSLVGAAALFAFYFLLALVYPSGMGFGDVKLAGILGMYLGWLGYAELVVGGFLGFLFGGVLGGALMLVGKAGRKTKIPFGPFMLLGAFVAVLWGGAIGDLYLNALGR
jgi:leader peptidase (prepilin peptidase)/N-methyltransferase